MNRNPTVLVIPMRQGSTLRALLIPILLGACTSRLEGTDPGDCTDGADNDGDGLFDCDDDGCAGSPDCEDADTAGDTGRADSDGDGWTVVEGDCDDTTASVFPGAGEIVADGIDQDCDGGDLCYQDTDHDGYGSAVVVAGADLDCADPGEASTSTDCMDSGSNAGFAFPGAAPFDSTTACMMDHDGDEYGSTTAPGTGTAGTDCDDEDASVIPGGVEVCGDGVDNDCDGRDAACRYEGTIGLASTAFRLVGESGYAGYSVAPAGDVDADGYDDLLVGAYQNSASDTSTGAAYLVCGPITGDLDLSTADVKLSGEYAYDYAGWSVASAGDVDADGYDDLLVGAYAGGIGGDETGVAYLVYGPVLEDLNLSAADAMLMGEHWSDWAGGSVASAGDVNADGYDDLLVGACYNDEGGSHAGAAYLVHGPVTGDLDLSAADAKLIGEDPYVFSGWSVASAGDVDADGHDDLLVGAPGDATGGTGAGATYLIYGPVVGALDLSAADTKLIGEEASDEAGRSVASAGDVDADGYDDVLIGASYNSDDGGNAGAAYLVYGPVVGDLDLSAADSKLIGEDPYVFTGWSVASAGDVDADDYDDLLVGAPSHKGSTNAGAVYLVYGPVGGDLDLSAADAKFFGEHGGDCAGISVASAGDVDRDGHSDLLVGAFRYDTIYESDVGAAYVLVFDERP